MLHFMNALISDPKYHTIFAALKGARNGAIYGGKVRFCHSLVMTFLFGKGTPQEKMQRIFALTYQHGSNLAKFAVMYKILCAILRRIQGKRAEYQSFLAAGITGYTVFGEDNAVNQQVCLYLLSRVVAALFSLGQKKAVLPLGTERRPLFPWFAASVWAFALWLHEYHNDDLQPGLRQSMDYIYDDSEKFTCLQDLIVQNDVV